MSFPHQSLFLKVFLSPEVNKTQKTPQLVMSQRSHEDFPVAGKRPDCYKAPTLEPRSVNVSVSVDLLYTVTTADV